MVAYWPLNEGTGTNITDYAGSNDGVTAGNPQWVKDGFRPQPFVPTTQTVSLTGVAGSWTNLIVQVRSENERNGLELSIDWLTATINKYRRRFWVSNE